MTTIIIARHGNTFESGETPRRVGARTDLPLTEKGLAQGRAIGRWLKEQRMIPDAVYTSTLQRTIQTAKAAIKESGVSNPVFPLEIFNEIDYGPDENLPEDAVIARLGADALKDWDERAIVPDGWLTKPDDIIKNWIGFADQVSLHEDGETILVVTSNGIARFAPYITDDFELFRQNHDIKLSTGALGILRHDGRRWAVSEWNVRPQID